MANAREDLLRALEEELRRSSAEGVTFLQAIAERSGMNLTDLQCINILMVTGPITAGQLAEEMRLTTGAITGVVNRLERAGYVQRERDPGDGRRVVIRLDSEALERGGAGLFGTQGGEVWTALLAGYDDRDLAVVLDFMRKSAAVTRAETARILAASAGDGGGGLAVPLGSTKSGRLIFTNGAYRLTLRAGSGMDDLYQARFESPAPTIEVENGVVSVRFPRRFKLFGWRGNPGEVVLNAAVPWAVEIRSGAAEIDADLRGLELTSFVFTGGFSDLTLKLPEPSGVVPVRLTGGASKARILRPAGSEARLSVKGGFNELTFDDQAFETMGGKMQLQSPGFDRASDRYEIELSGGASEITIQTETQG